MDGILVRTEEGSPQGGPISPLLANIYLHYVLDLWFHKRHVKNVRGKAYLTRFADDFIVAFEFQVDAKEFEEKVRERLKEFNLELAEPKTGKVRFGRLPHLQRKQMGSFTFLGFQHVAGRDRQGRFAVIRLPAQKSCSRLLDTVKSLLRAHIHARGPQIQMMLLSKLRGFYRYFGLNGCQGRLGRLRYQIMYAWRQAWRLRGQRSKFEWCYLNRCSWFTLPRPEVVHPFV